jgi:hypothetical protein
MMVMFTTDGNTDQIGDGPVSLFDAIDDFLLLLRRQVLELCGLGQCVGVEPSEILTQSSLVAVQRPETQEEVFPVFSIALGNFQPKPESHGRIYEIPAIF